MYYVHVALYGYNQLKVVNPTLLAGLEEHFARVVHANGGSWQVRHPYQMTFPSEYAESGMIAMESAFDLFDLLSERRKEHIGSTILVSDRFESEQAVARLLSLATLDDYVWIDTASMPALGNYVESTDMGHLALVHGLHSTLWAMRDVQLEWLFQSSIKHVLKKHFYGVLQRKFLLFYGEMGMGKRYSIEVVLAEVSHHDAFSFAKIDSYTQKYDLLRPFLSLFCGHVLARMEHDILEEEQAMFAPLQGFIAYIKERKSPHSLDRMASDLLQLAFFYFRSYRKYCQEERLPGWVLVYHSQYLHPMNQKIFHQVLEIMHHYGLTVVAVEHKLIEFPHYEVEAYRVNETYYYEDGLLGVHASDGAQVMTPYEAILWQWLESQEVVVESVDLASLLHGVFWQLDELAQRVLFQVMLADGMIDVATVVASLELDGQGQLLVYKRLRLLEKLRLITDVQSAPRLMFTLLQIELYAYAGSQAQAYVARLGEYLLKYRVLGEDSLWYLFMLVEKSGAIDATLGIIHDNLHGLLDARRVDVRFYLTFNYLEDRELSHTQRATLKAILYTAKLRSKMLKHQIFSDSERFVDDLPYVEASDNIFANYYLLQKYRNEAMEMELEERLVGQLKKLTFSFQKNSEHKGEALANYELAFVLFKQGKVRQGLEFGEIALRLFSTFGFVYGELMAMTLQARMVFCYGNLSLAREHAHRAQEHAQAMGNHQRWQIARFIESRIDIELGRYEHAILRLEEDLALAEQYHQQQAAKVLKNWIFLCYVYKQEWDKAKAWGSALAMDLELSYFYAIMYWQQEEYEAMVAVLDASYELDRDRHYTVSEDEEWLDGYHVLEGQRGYGERYGVLRTMADELRLYALAKATNQSEEHHKAIDALRLACDLHETQIERPYNFILPYLYADNLKKEDETFAIAINRSARIAMSWANRIADVRVKEMYTHGQFWLKRIQLLRKNYGA
ncbi:hypothetical protein [Entomospira culicis]|uniref:MalT-like TPR region domain-containing protein n=1 Tax=Entomospira culicis TaxID=2719989 RepID=A0A968GHS6_9SPIO|nr:hypothetical protein [Entomospira culicis]NIZ18665.1 hypothetical protein [Entomospira culicis]NIZ68880.1 hypothetical protein [Entomospira culicis]WDI37473.1 hypothetical protein PVA46_01410 [Entomospira culicis]WDI39101.1 hypothetical protein PVA47_01415 [Entomospira culicis]